VAEARVGQQYEKINGAGLVWEVVAVKADLNGLRHCYIVDVKDRTNVKLISESTLTNRKFYRLLAEPRSGSGELE
jgi:hypothetical protein